MAEFTSVDEVLKAAIKDIQEDCEVEMFKIENTDIILKEYGKGNGKIIISNFQYNFSYHWGAMGSTLKEFLLDINHGYFCNKLSPSVRGPLDVKKTFANFRKVLKEYYYCDFPWYKEMEFQKHLREEIKNLESSVESEHQFVDYVYDLVKNKLDYYLIENKYERERIQSCLLDAVSEPWHCLVYGNPREFKFLVKLHKQLKKRFKKELKK